MALLLRNFPSGSGLLSPCIISVYFSDNLSIYHIKLWKLFYIASDIFQKNDGKSWSLKQQDAKVVNYILKSSECVELKSQTLELLKEKRLTVVFTNIIDIWYL